MLANSAVVTSLALLLLIIQLFFDQLPILFWLVVVTKVSDDVLAVSINSASTRILLQPLPIQLRVSVQAVLESIVVPASIGLVGLLILVQFIGDISPRQSVLVLVLLSLI